MVVLAPDARLIGMVRAVVFRCRLLVERKEQFCQ
jgi:hypothetical protein